MNNGGEAADQMVREALQFSEVAIKLTALGFKNSLAIALAYAKENPKVRGKTSLDRLLREGKEMKIIPLQTKDLAQFKAYAKQYGVLFASIKDKSAQGEKIDIKTMEDIDPRPSFKTVAAQLRKAAARSAERAVNATRKEER